eukprot:3276434-Rhodomonas_salina.2
MIAVRQDATGASSESFSSLSFHPYDSVVATRVQAATVCESPSRVRVESPAAVADPAGAGQGP